MLAKLKLLVPNPIVRSTKFVCHAREEQVPCVSLYSTLALIIAPSTGIIEYNLELYIVLGCTSRCDTTAVQACCVVCICEEDVMVEVRRYIRTSMYSTTEVLHDTVD